MYYKHLKLKYKKKLIQILNEISIILIFLLYNHF